MLQEGLYTKVCKRRSKENRSQISPVDSLLIKIIRSTVQKLDILLQLIIVILAKDRGKLGIIQRVVMRFHLPGSTLGCLKKLHCLAFAIKYSFKIMSAADRPVNRAGTDIEHILNVIQKLKRILRLAVKLIDKGKNRDMAHDTYFKQLDSLRLHALGAIDNHNC